MKIAVTGASGLIGTGLRSRLTADGHDVLRLVRRAAAAPDEVSWNPQSRSLDPAALSGVDAVVHLAGVGVADHRWTETYRAQILASRVDGTTTIAAAMAAAEPRPRTLISASAVGYYGDTGDRITTETGPAGTGFLADVCSAWENATAPAADAGIRVATLRTGLVLSPSGGLLGRMAPLAKLGVLSPLGSGEQYQPWISLADEIRAIAFLLADDRAAGISGPVNITGPEPVTNSELTRTINEVVGKPTWAPKVPGIALKLALGGFAEEGVLVGQRAIPRVLADHGFGFTHPTLEASLRWALA